MYGYVRVSSIKQVEGGLSLDYQEGAIKKYYDFLESQLTVGDRMPKWGGIFREEGKSSWKLSLVSRHEGWRMHRQLKCGDHVVIARLDRGFRNLQDMNRTIDMWRGAGVRIHLLDVGGDLESATGKMFVQMVGLMAEFESHIRSERQVAHVEAWRAEGNRLPTEWGYDVTTYVRDGKKRRITKVNYQQVAAMRLIHWMVFTKRFTYEKSGKILYDILLRRKQEGRPADARLLKNGPINRPLAMKLMRRLRDMFPNRGFKYGTRRYRGRAKARHAG